MTSRRRKLASPGPGAEERHPENTLASFLVPTALLETARDAAYALRVLDPPATLAGIAVRGIRAEVHRLQRRYNRGKSFPARSGELRPGRRVGGA